ncbi:hypothetical protein SOASR031_26260 [Leminorella grimontii]|nr:hypothetical protein SOASR031_26260 [Leminorella grimontii]
MVISRGVFFSQADWNSKLKLKIASYLEIDMDINYIHKITMTTL